jgi:phytoene desaturase
VDGYVKYVRLTEAGISSSFKGLTDRPFLQLGDMLKIMPDILRLQAFWGTYFRVSQLHQGRLPAPGLLVSPRCSSAATRLTRRRFTPRGRKFEKQWGVHYAIGGTGAS